MTTGLNNFWWMLSSKRRADVGSENVDSGYAHRPPAAARVSLGPSLHTHPCPSPAVITLRGASRVPVETRTPLLTYIISKCRTLRRASARGRSSLTPSVRHWAVMSRSAEHAGTRARKPGLWAPQLRPVSRLSHTLGSAAGRLPSRPAPTGAGES